MNYPRFVRCFSRVSIVFSSIAVVFGLFFSCAAGRPGSIPQNTQGMPVSRLIADAGIKSEKQLAAFFLAYNSSENLYRVRRIAAYYIKEARKEGINSDMAFAQMCLETGFLKFGGLVTSEMNNYCGLGSIDEDHPGERFSTEQLGIRAHIQHLQAYALTTPLKGKLVDPRYKYVQPRGKSPDIFGLAGTWASDKAYGQKLDALLERLGKY
ncbi:MAG: glucosaminidase domain-containing protein [Treponemataceae bacterium]|nr:MAG: glucosaminidase domain-containing protein [Treponemataceae bacterium]